MTGHDSLAQTGFRRRHQRFAASGAIGIT